MRIVIIVITALSLFVLPFATPSFAAKKDDPCREKGIIVKNLTTRDLWYKHNGGACTIWVKDHIFVIKPDETVDIFSDLICKTKYCKDDLNYEAYRTFDVNGDCRIRILPGCNISDM